ISTDTSDFNFTSPLFCLAAFFAVLCCIVAALPQFFPGISEEFGQGASLGALMLSVGMGVNIVAKILFGILSDRYGAKPAMLTMSTLSTLGLLGIFLLHSRYGLLGGAMLFTFIYGNSALGVAMMATDLFGPENYNKVYPTLSLAGGIANAGAGTLIGLLYDGSGSYVSAILLVLVSEALIVFCILTAYLLKKRNPVSNA
ncbi:MAG: MFS transporter, partial [Solobacterium sp.]|nr:MFS transporter [Solobacterium sp.]